MGELGVVTNIIALFMVLVQIIIGFMLITKNKTLEGVNDWHIAIIGVIIIGLADIILIISILMQSQ